MGWIHLSTEPCSSNRTRFRQSPMPVTRSAHSTFKVSGYNEAMALNEISVMMCSWQCRHDSPAPCDGHVDRTVDDVVALALASPCSSQSEGSSSVENAALVASITGRFGDIEEKYRVDPRVLGAGHYSSVRACVELATGRRCAVKSVLKSDPAVDPSALARELSLLRRMDHPNVVRFADVYEDDRWLHIATDLCRGGELFDRIVERSSDTRNPAACFADGRAAAVVGQILSAVRYMHDNHIAHRDIKPENVLFETDEEDSRVKLIDFGLARIHVEDLEPRMRTIVGTPYYIAPEVLRKRYTRQADLWSLGVTAYIMLCGYPPFNGQDNEQVCASIRVGRYRFASCDWRGTTKAARDFVRGLLQMDPRRRMTAKEALAHPWIAKQRTV